MDAAWRNAVCVSTEATLHRCAPSLTLQPPPPALSHSIPGKSTGLVGPLIQISISLRNYLELLPQKLDVVKYLQ